MLPVSECALHTLPINHPRQSVYEVITRRVFTHIGIAGTMDITHRIIKALYSMPALKNGDDNVGYLTVISPLGKPLDCSFPFNKKATTFGWQHAGCSLLFTPLHLKTGTPASPSSEELIIKQYWYFPVVLCTLSNHQVLVG